MLTLLSHMYSQPGILRIARDWKRWVQYLDISMGSVLSKNVAINSVRAGIENNYGVQWPVRL